MTIKVLWAHYITPKLSHLGLVLSSCNWSFVSKQNILQPMTSETSAKNDDQCGDTDISLVPTHELSSINKDVSVPCSTW